MLRSSWVQTRITRHFANVISKKLNTEISIGRVDYQPFRKIKIEDFLILDHQNDTLMFSGVITAKIDTLNFKNKNLCINELEFNNNHLNISRDSIEGFNFNFLFEAIGETKKDSSSNWDVTCNSFLFDDSGITLSNFSAKEKETIFIDDLNLDITDFSNTNNTTKFKINHLSLNETNSINLEDFSTDVCIKNKQIDLTNCNIISEYSRINNTTIGLALPTVKDSVRQPLNFNFDIGKSRISFIEISHIIKSVEGMNQEIDFSGRIYGNINDIKGRDLVFRTGDSTMAKLNFYINDPRDTENMYLSFDLKEFTTSFSDISNVKLPDNTEVDYVQFPQSFYESGLLKFNGNFSGFLSDFVTYGTLKSDMGDLSTDILVTPDKGGFVHYQGNISTSDFELGNLLKNDNLGKLTFRGLVDGSYNNRNKKIYGIYRGNIAEIGINNYIYQNIKLDGKLLDKMFDGFIGINDDNLKFIFSGKVDFNPEIPDFDFALQLDKANLGALNISEKFPNSETAFFMNAKFSGDRIDNMHGFINVEKGTYKNKNGNINFGEMRLNTINTEGLDMLNFSSDFLDIEIKGKYHFLDMINAFKKTLNHFIPSYPLPQKNNIAINLFNYKINVKNINPLTDIVVPGLEMDTPFLLYGKFDSPDNNIELEGSIPGIKYNSVLIRNIFIGNKAFTNYYSSKFRFGEIQIGKEKRLYNFKIESKAKEDVLENTISWKNYSKPTYSGDISTRTEFSRTDSSNMIVKINGLPSRIIIADTLLSIDPFVVTIDSSSMAVSGFNIHSDNQKFAINGITSKGKNDMLEMDLKNFNLKSIDLYTKRRLGISGIANGTFGISNLFDKTPIIISDLNIDKLSYKNQLMGDVLLKTQWDNNKSAIYSNLQVIRKNRISLDATGFYIPTSGKVNFNAAADSVPLFVLDPFIKGSISDFKGYGSGSLNISSNANKILMNGALMGHNAGLTIDATQVAYTFNDSVYFKNDTILFDNLTIYDDQNNSGTFYGTLVHDNFKNTQYNLHVNSDKIMAMNTTSSNNELFYGVAFVNGRLNITGIAKTINLSGRIKSLNGTEIKISMESESKAEQYDFIKFVEPKYITKEKKFYKEKKEEKSNLNMRFVVEATSDAKIQLVYNSQIGDIIKAQGKGVLVCEMNKDGELFLSGDYHIEKGDYLFTLKNLMNKRFSIETGGSIVWTGDPYNANIDLKAIYKQKASLYDLVVNSYQTINQYQRIQVESIIHLEDELTNPTISFDINFPNAEENIKDYLEQFFSTDEDMNKQILSLIVLGKFYTPDYLRGTYEAQNSNMLGTTVSEMLSNQLSNWVSQINDNFDVGVNYRPGNGETNDEIELALSTQMFNDRVSLNGNIGNNASTNSTNSSQIVGDFEIGVRLVPSGKLQLKAYHRSNDNLIYETAPYTQGVGISISEEFNSIDELLEKIRTIFKFKNKKTLK